MNGKIIKRIAIGVALYAAIVIGLIKFNPDDTADMGWEDRQDFNKVQISKLELGTSRSAILELLGPPDISEAKKQQDQHIQVMFYRTHHVKSDGITTQSECTALLFENDVLTAWGEGAYQDYLAN